MRVQGQRRMQSEDWKPVRNRMEARRGGENIKCKARTKNGPRKNESEAKRQSLKREKYREEDKEWMNEERTWGEGNGTESSVLDEEKKQKKMVEQRRSKAGRKISLSHSHYHFGCKGMQQRIIIRGQPLKKLLLLSSARFCLQRLSQQLVEVEAVMLQVQLITRALQLLAKVADGALQGRVLRF